MRNLKLMRAFACYWIMKAIEVALSPMPRSRRKVAIVNALCRPFFGYGAYWALRSNPNMRDTVKRSKRP